MAINFCKRHHSPKLLCSQVAYDGYEVDNLITSKSSIKGQGFRAEYFIKPPVDITFSVDIPIEISHIILGLRSGSFQVTGVEIWTKPQGDMDVYYPVGKCFSSATSLLCFINKAYNSRGAFQEFQKELPNDGEVRYLHSKNYSHLSSVSHVLVRITRTANSCAPVLSLLEVWGQAGRMCKPEAIKSIIDAEKNSNLSIENLNNSTGTDRETNTVKSPCPVSDDPKRSSNDDVETEIPQEFIDPISCEFMALPVLLPSGQTVDRSTLDKYLEAEAVWGRPPSDPFTGVRLRKGQDAVPNVALKARIDHFLVKHGSHVKYIPRTVGRSSDPLINVARDSSTVHSSRSQDSIEAAHCENSGQLGDNNDQPSNYLSFSGSIHKSSSVETLNTSPACENIPSKAKRLKVVSATQNSTVCNQKYVGVRPGQSHEERLSSSLDMCLKSTLSGLQTFTKPVWTSALTFTHTFPKCSSCKTDMKSGQFLLPCTHSLCRNCLFLKRQEKHLVCCECEHEFKPSEVVHSHQ